MKKNNLLLLMVFSLLFISCSNEQVEAQLDDKGRVKELTLTPKEVAVIHNKILFAYYNSNTDTNRTDNLDKFISDLYEISIQEINTYKRADISEKESDLELLYGIMSGFHTTFINEGGGGANNFYLIVCLIQV